MRQRTKNDSIYKPKYKITPQDLHVPVKPSLDRGYFVLKEVTDVTCCVCKKWDRIINSTFYPTQCLYMTELFTLDDIDYYIIPEYPSHSNCRELFQINPLAYVDIY